ncbi:glycine cleavage system protein GcvH [Limisphaera sp. VF-2]|uniref:glycine cleavage system protein GcvH n=1 Tax=Limisphaera sp. VF-2 TaxID=3400418 RepID=UPI00175E0D46|nr:glycine cleavage system protein GcvH [Limisphaera sp.]
MANVPGELRYTKTHEWVRLDGGVATVGITDHAQRELTDIVFVELPAVGRELRAGEACGVVESVKTASDLYSPLTGRVVEVNSALPDHPGWINSDPYGQGWLFKLAPSQLQEWDGLLSPEEYRAQIEGV